MTHLGLDVIAAALRDAADRALRGVRITKPAVAVELPEETRDDAPLVELARVNMPTLLAQLAHRLHLDVHRVHGARVLDTDKVDARAALRVVTLAVRANSVNRAGGKPTMQSARATAPSKSAKDVAFR